MKQCRVGRTQTYTPVEIVGYEVSEAGIPESKDSGSVKKYRRLFMMIILLVLLSCSGIVSYAAERYYYPSLIIVDTENDDANFQDLCIDINERLHDAGYFLRDYGTHKEPANFIGYVKKDDVVVIVLNMLDYSNYSEATKAKVYDIVLNSIKESDLSQSNKTKLYNFVQEQDTVMSSLIKRLSTDVSADFVEGAKWFQPFARGIGVFLGCAVMLIFVSLFTTIMLDICYLVIPAMNMWFSRQEQKEIFHTGIKYKFISLEAKKAYDEACASDGIAFKNAIGLYFGMKTKTLTALVLCLAYLLSGRLFDVLASFMDLFVGFLPK